MRRTASAVVVACMLTASAGIGGGRQDVFRGGITMVPIDVRAFDRHGRPVTDLTAKDFIVAEDGVPQTITHFSTRTFTAGAPETQPVRAAQSDGFPTADAARSPGIAPQASRVYLIVLGRGRLQVPNKGVDGVLSFVRNRLLPGDRVALFAYNRATAFTSDHGSLVPIIERYLRAHEAIEVELALHFSGLAGLYRSPEIPAAIQADIDGIFGDRDPAGTRTVVPDAGNRDRRDAEYRRGVTDALIGDPSAGAAGRVLADVEGMSFDAFVAATTKEGLDVANIQAGIDYLRHIDGEKHLVFIASGGFKTSGFSGTLDSLARAASHARVALDIVHTGGIEFRYASSEPQTIARKIGIGSDPFDAYLYGGTTAASVQTSRMLANETGGMFNVNRYRRVADDLAAMEEAARFHYTLGYYPTRRAVDGDYRRIEVRTTRPGVTLRFRGGYYARPQPAAFGRRELLSFTRIARAFEYAQPIDDIKITGHAAVARAPDGGRRITVDVTIDSSRLAYDIVDGRRAGSVEVALFAIDGRQRQIADLWQRVELNLSEDTYRRFMADGIRHSAEVSAPDGARAVKLVVYDYAADLVGSVVLALK